MPEIEGSEQIMKGFLQADDVEGSKVTVQLNKETIRTQEGKFGAQLYLDVVLDKTPYTWTPTGKGARFLFDKYGTNSDDWPDKLVIVKEQTITKDGKKFMLYPAGAV